MAFTNGAGGDLTLAPCDLSAEYLTSWDYSLRRYAGISQDARSRGDFFGETTLLILDLPHASPWPRTPENHCRHRRTLAPGNLAGSKSTFWRLPKVDAALYRPPRTAGTSSRGRGLVRGSRLLWVQSLRVWFQQTRARAALALAAQEPSARARLLRLARGEARAIGSARHPWCEAMAEHLLGLAEAIDGEPEAALTRLSRAAIQLDSADMPIYAAAARRALGQLAGPHAGARWVREADEFMQARGIVDPSRFSRMLAPQLSVERRLLTNAAD